MILDGSVLERRMYLCVTVCICFWVCICPHLEHGDAECQAQVLGDVTRLPVHRHVGVAKVHFDGLNLKVVLARLAGDLYVLPLVTVEVNEPYREVTWAPSHSLPRRLARRT